MSELRSLSLEAALAAAVLRARIERAMPELPALPSLPGLPALPHWSSFRRPSGLLVPAAPAAPVAPAAPALILAREGAGGSGAGGGRSRASWAEAVDPDGLAAFLRREHPAKTAIHVAARTGESRETVRKWLRRETRPGMRATLVLVCVYGLPLVEACIRRQPSWLAQARAESGRHALAAQLAALRPQIEAALT